MTATRLPVGRARSWYPWLALAGVVILLQTVFFSQESFPALADQAIEGPIDSFNSWVRAHRLDHPLFTGFFTPISDGISGSLAVVESFLLWLPWFVLPVALLVIVGRTGRWVMTLVAAAGILYPGLVGLWDLSMETLSLMAVAVAISLAIGIPLGVWASLKPKVDKVLRPILDAMQTVPAPVYLIPMVLFFGVRRVPAAAATIIYALPPAVRLTTLGISQVPSETVEAARIFGSNRRQILTKVQLPLAAPSILAGVNQTIMMALGIVVIASLVGAGGLGQAVYSALQRRSPGRGFAAGLAIVALAMVLDRVGRTFVEPTDRVRADRRRWWIWGAVAVVGATVLGRVTGWLEFPAVWDTAAFRPIDQAILAARDVLYPITRPFNDFLVASVLLPTVNFLSGMAWPVLVAVTAFICWRVRGWGLALFSVVGLSVIGLTGLWELSIDTLVQTLAAVVISVAIAVPIGIWAGRSRRVEAVLAPILDGLQTIPSFVYIIPVVMLFTVSRVPGIIASVLYAIPPGIRLTALGIKHVSGQAIEASQAFGATGRQTLWGVRVPLAAPSIMAAINQVIMMVLAMVIIAGLVGGGGLGFKAVEALTRPKVGLGFEVGLAIVIMAIILDRLTQALAERSRPPAFEH